MRNKHTFPLSTTHVWATSIAWRVLAWLHFGTFIADRGDVFFAWDGKTFPLEWVNAIEAQRFLVSCDPILNHQGDKLAGWQVEGLRRREPFPAPDLPPSLSCKSSSD